MRQKLIIVSALISAAIIITGLLAPVIAQSAPTDILQAAADYHIAANNLVNKKLQLVATVMEELQEDTSQRTTAAELFKKLDNREECLNAPENLSVFCLYNQLSVLYEEFEDRLNRLPAPTNSDLGAGVGTASTRRDLQIQLRDQARNVLNSTLDAYGQIIIANVLHAENLATIKQVEQLSENLGDLVSEVEELPFNFVNVSTAFCK